MPKVTQFKIGDKASLTKKFSAEEVKTFANISLDKNPIHIDEVFAKSTIFKQRIVHGILLSGLISAVLGTKLPGEGAIYREQTLTFKKPAFLDEEVTATVEIIEIKTKIGLLIMKTTIKNAEGQTLVTGQAKGIVEKE